VNFTLAGRIVPPGFEVNGYSYVGSTPDTPKIGIEGQVGLSYKDGGQLAIGEL
jgi:hypothetical protein